jgi:hypothetical protein
LATVPPELFGTVEVVDVVDAVVGARVETVVADDLDEAVVEVAGGMVTTGMAAWPTADCTTVVVVTLTTISSAGATVVVVVVVAAARELPVTVADAVRYPPLAALTVIVDEAAGDIPVTVTRPADCAAEPVVAVKVYE